MRLIIPAPLAQRRPARFSPSRWRVYLAHHVRAVLDLAGLAPDDVRTVHEPTHAGPRIGGWCVLEFDADAEGVAALDEYWRKEFAVPPPSAQAGAAVAADIGTDIARCIAYIATLLGFPNAGTVLGVVELVDDGVDAAISGQDPDVRARLADLIEIIETQVDAEESGAIAAGEAIGVIPSSLAARIRRTSPGTQ